MWSLLLLCDEVTVFYIPQFYTGVQALARRQFLCLNLANILRVVFVIFTGPIYSCALNNFILTITKSSVEDIYFGPNSGVYFRCFSGSLLKSSETLGLQFRGQVLLITLIPIFWILRLVFNSAIERYAKSWEQVSIETLFHLRFFI